MISDMRISRDVVLSLWAQTGHDKHHRVTTDGTFEHFELMGGPGGGVDVREDGELWSWSIEVAGKKTDTTWARATESEAIVALVSASTRHPCLQSSLPARVAGSPDCAPCAGCGKITLPTTPPFDVFCSECNGLGWLR